MNSVFQYTINIYPLIRARGNARLTSSNGGTAKTSDYSPLFLQTLFERYRVSTHDRGGQTQKERNVVSNVAPET